MNDKCKDDCKCNDDPNLAEALGKGIDKAVLQDTPEALKYLILQDYKQHCNATLLREWQTMMERILDYAQVASGENWPPLRSKILRVTNDFMRNMRRELDLDLTTKETE